MKVCTLHIQEIIRKKLYAIYKKLKPYFKRFFALFYNGFSHFCGKKKQIKHVLIIRANNK